MVISQEKQVKYLIFYYMEEELNTNSETNTENNNNFEYLQRKLLNKDSNKKDKYLVNAKPIPKKSVAYLNFNKYSIICTFVAVFISLLIYFIPYYLFKLNLIKEGIFIFIVCIIILISIILIYIICNYENGFALSRNRII